MAHDREIRTLTGRFERWALPRMAARLPALVTPDMLTASGVIAALSGGIGFLMAGQSLAWLHLTSVALVVHWAADSLDGTLARQRRIERPTYGTFVDATSDAVSAWLLLGGLAASGVVQPWLALVVLGGYLSHFGFAFVVAAARGVLRLAPTGGVGPTELRLVVIAANTLVWATGNPVWTPYTGPLAGAAWTLFDGLLAGAGVLLVGSWLVSAAVERAALARLDPTPAPTPEAEPDGPLAQDHETPEA